MKKITLILFVLNCTIHTIFSEIITIKDCGEVNYWRTKYLDKITEHAFMSAVKNHDPSEYCSFMQKLFRLYAFEKRGLLCNKYSTHSAFKNLLFHFRNEKNQSSLENCCIDPFGFLSIDTFPEFDETFKSKYHEWLKENNNSERIEHENIFQSLLLFEITVAIGEFSDEKFNLENYISESGGLEKVLLEASGTESLHQYREISESFHKLFCN